MNNPLFENLPIYVNNLWGPINIGIEDGYHAIALRALGIDPARIHFIDQTFAVDRLIVPEQRFWYETPGVQDFQFIEFLSRAQEYIEAGLRTKAPQPKQIYVSRTEWRPVRGVVVGESEFEAFLVKCGYKVIYPETINFREQLEHYAAAESIIFAEGSAIHACMLLPRLAAKVALIKRRKETPPRGAVKTSLFGFANELYVVHEVYKYLAFGMPEWSGVSYVNYDNVSRSLASAGFFEAIFDEWDSVKRRAEDLAITRFCKDAADYEEFRSFLIKAASA
jgi:hypothetical protein